MTTADQVTLEAISREVAYLRDERDVLDRIYAYCHFIDNKLSEEWLDCFTDDGAFIVRMIETNPPDIELRGKDALRAWIDDYHAKALGGSNHMVINPRVLAIEGDVARTASYYLLASFRDGVLNMNATGRYNDRLLRCSDGRWRIQERLAHRNVVFSK